jgi:hypothetical protein
MAQTNVESVIVRGIAIDDTHGYVVNFYRGTVSVVDTNSAIPAGDGSAGGPGRVVGTPGENGKSGAAD